ncbi:hypothetical protein GCK72_022657 [Caenorhabditis remanei]|uniref:Uncharacterized protein n=1 Tax=Caenorhabditis remanei TaxID=31234 RepID=A0A6A5FUK0_CAERE|nr:hypothetical protein GCK72_022657 [Caenorhabditis remanei]KAF1746204.1 hypothetical protein GCK72_022657 [Caenorhabditis remanei]
MFDISPGLVLATGYATGIMMLSAQFNVDNFKNHSEKLRAACRKAKSRVTDDKEMRELKKSMIDMKPPESGRRHKRLR